jgi:hypothetical protein
MEMAAIAVSAALDRHASGGKDMNLAINIV